MKKLILLAVAASAIFFFSCDHKHNHDHATGSTNDYTATAVNYQQGETGVKLNNGKKWKANIETTQGIETMQNMTANYKTGADVEKLKTDLQAEFKTIFKKCTMTGEAHEQLHNYLIPLKDKLSKLNNENIDKKIEDLQAYLATYKNYFE